MSVTFCSNAPETITETPETCMCVYEGAAEPWCPWCQGSGTAIAKHSDLPFVNLSNCNAAILLEALGLPFDYCGAVSIADARRAVMRARNTNTAHLARPELVVHGRPVEREGVVELRPLRQYDPGLSADDISDRVERFAALVEQSATMGATEINWG